MKQTYEQHLVVREVSFLPGGEWSRQSMGWSFVHFTSGIGYWLSALQTLELPTGSVLVLSPSIEGTIRASQISPALIHFFTVEPKLLVGLVTLGEQRILEEAADKAELSFQLLAAAQPIAERFRELLRERRNRLRLRLQLLALFFDSLGKSLDREAITDDLDVRRRLEIYLKTLPEWGLVDVKFSDLAEQARCTPRHLSRVFRKFVGKPFREKQLELRLARAKELLATTRLRIRQVAVESGYRSACLFNEMFKSQVGMSPGKWRRLVQKQQAQAAKAYHPTTTTADRNGQGAAEFQQIGARSRNPVRAEATLPPASLLASRDACTPARAEANRGL